MTVPIVDIQPALKQPQVGGRGAAGALGLHALLRAVCRPTPKSHPRRSPSPSPPIHSLAATTELLLHRQLQGHPPRGQARRVLLGCARARGSGGAGGRPSRAGCQTDPPDRATGRRGTGTPASFADQASHCPVTNSQRTGFVSSSSMTTWPSPPARRAPPLASRASKSTRTSCGALSMNHALRRMLCHAVPCFALLLSPSICHLHPTCPSTQPPIMPQRRRTLDRHPLRAGGLLEQGQHPGALAPGTRPHAARGGRGRRPHGRRVCRGTGRSALACCGVHVAGTGTHRLRSSTACLR